MNQLPKNITDQISHQAVKRGYWNPRDAPNIMAGAHGLPNESAYDVESQLTTYEALAMLGLTPAIGEQAGNVSKYTLDGKESATKLDQVSSNLLISELQLANATPMKKMSTQAFLRPAVLEATLIKKLSPLLPWIEKANRQTVSTWEIAVPRMTYSFLRDPKLKIGQRIDEDGELPLVSLSELEKVPLSIGRYGLATLFSEKAQQNSAVGLNEVNLGLEAVKYALQFTFNKMYVDEIGNHFSTSYRTGLHDDDQVILNTISTTWDDPAATIFKDVRTAALTAEETEDWFAESTHLYVNGNTNKDIMNYATFSGHEWEINPITGQKIFRIDDIQIVKLPPLNGMPDGSALLTSEPAGAPPLLDVYDMVNTNLTKSGMLHVREDSNSRTGSRWFGFERYMAARLNIAKRVTWMNGVR